MPEQESLKSTAAWLCTSNPSNIWAEGTAHSLPENFGRYRIVNKLGEGGMGAVYLAHDTVLDRKVALKVPRFAATDDPDVLDRFRQEAKAAATVQHPNLCPIFDVGAIDGIHYLTMAYIEGKSLHDWIAGKPLAQSTAAKLTRLIALGLDAAHAQGVIHRDLKPSNILINERKEPIVMDFGLARRTNSFDTRLTCMGLMMGTPAYMSPEQARGNVDATGPRSDLYTLGVILYELLTARLPFTGSSALEMISKVTTETPAPPSQHRPDLDPQLEAICLKAMAKNIDDRYPNMRALADELRKYLESLRGKETPAKIDPANTAGREAPVAMTPVATTPVAPPPREATPVPRAPVTYVGPSRKRPVPDSFPAGLRADREAPQGPASKAHAAAWLDWARRHKLWLGALASAALVTILVVVFLRGTPEAPTGNGGNKNVAAKAVTSDFRPLFNGKDLTGFTVDSGDPESWRIENGELVVTGGKGLGWLLTEEKRSDFVLRFDFQTGAKANSGVALRAMPGETAGSQAGKRVPLHLEVAILDDDSYAGASALTGALYWAKTPPLPPDERAILKAPPAWNRMEITLRGRSLRVVVNGKQVRATDLDTLVGSGGARSGVASASGRIGFQSHTGTVRFRNIEIKDLASGADGWVQLFNGKDLTGWKSHPSQPGNWRVEFGELVSSGASGHLFSERGDYADFHLRAEVLVPEDGNSGIYFRSRYELEQFDSGEPTPKFLPRGGYQADLLWGGARKPGRIIGIANSGSIINVGEAAKVSAQPDQWLTLEMVADGTHLITRVNGQTVVDAVDNAALFKTGHIVLQTLRPLTTVRFKKIEIKEIKPVPKAPDSKSTSLAQLNLGTAAWVSDDCLTIYFEVWNNGDPWIWTGRRQNPESPFADRAALLRGKHPCLSNDELELIFYLDKRLHRARRTARNQPFGAPAPIFPQDATPHGQPFLSADGRTLVFQQVRDGRYYFMTCQRKNREAPWQTPAPLPMVFPAGFNVPISWPFLTADGRTLLCLHGATDKCRIAVWTRADDGRFRFDRYLEVPGMPLVHRAPRYIAKTSELFFTAPGPSGAETWMLKNFRLARQPY